jgi:hypothetical protein
VNVQITAITLHTREQVEAILDEAAMIAATKSHDGGEWPSYFAAAVALLGARHVIETPAERVSMPLPPFLGQVG